MSENRFAHCTTVEHVLRSLLPIEPPKVWDALEADALARIAELTRPVVDEAARERAVKIIQQECGANYPRAEEFLDWIIDALGYTTVAILTANNCDECGTRSITRDGRCANKCAVSPAPAVELDADDLNLLAELLTKWSDVALNLSVDIDHRLPIGYGCIRNRDTDGAWVLRIGGGDE